MFENFSNFDFDFADYISDLGSHPWQIVTFVLDMTIVIFLLVYFVKVAKKSRVWQLLKGIVLLIVITILSNLLELRLLYFILTSFMSYGVIALLIIFQPELRRAIEQLGSRTFSRLFGIDKSIMDKTKEDIYKVVIAAEEMAKSKTGALIVFERDIKIQDIIETGIKLDSEISPQMLVNIFVPKTPLHDGAVIISNNKITAAACILPLADDKDIARELGTRHRAAIGISKESDAIAVVVSEETGKISIAKDGTLIADVKEDALKRILIKNLVTAKFGSEKRVSKINSIKEKWANKKLKKQSEKTEVKSNK